MAKAGATVASNPAEVASQSGTVVTMLPNNDIVTAVYTGKDGVFQYVYYRSLPKNMSLTKSNPTLRGLQPGSILLDSSTVDPSIPIALVKQAQEKGSFFLDTPVSGGLLILNKIFGRND